jgi:SPP1 family predicted phage head-tail adaptor
MIIGRMDKRITLEEPVKTPDGKGGFTTIWTPRGTVWAEFKKPTFETKEAAGAVQSVSRREFKIRYRSDVVKGWRIVYGTQVILIDHVYDIGKAETFLVVREMVK